MTEKAHRINFTLYYNLLGQTTKTIAAHTATGTPTSSTNQTTTYTYDGNGDETGMTAVVPSGMPSQTTAWIFGVSTATGSTIDSNDLLAKVEYPNATTGAASASASDNVSYNRDNLGEAIGMTDQNGTTHSIGLDVLGRGISDSVIVLGSGVDGTVRLRMMNYDTQGSVYQMTAYGSTLGGTILNQVQDVHNGLGQLTGEYQSHSGAVVTTGPTPTPETQYGYSDPVACSLLTSMTYPNGRILHYGRNNNALDAAIGRVDYLADDNGSGGVGSHLVDYLYMGAGTIVQQADANGVKLTYLQQPGDSSAITTGPQYAGDIVTGLNRFGQVIDQNWVNATTPTPTTTDRFQYNYDQNGNVLYKNNLVNGAFSELYHANSTTSGDNGTAYDPLNRLTAFARGTLSASSHNGGVLDTVSSPSTTQSWNLDAVGNQNSVTTSGTTVTNAANAKNELTANGSNGLTFDNNGNTKTDQSGNAYSFDAWNHIAAVKNASGTTIATYQSDALGRRIGETNSSGVTTASYFNGAQIIEQRQGGTVTDQYVFNIDFVNDVLLRDDNSTSGNLGKSGSGLGERLFSQRDANFDVTALVNTSGVVVQRSVYGPYGTVTVLSPSWTSTTDAYSFNPGFQGMWRDPVTGLYYTPNRDYEPATGTWRETDPTGYAYGVNPYQMVASDPANLIDPTGESQHGHNGPYVPQLYARITRFYTPYVDVTPGKKSTTFTVGIKRDYIKSSRSTGMQHVVDTVTAYSVSVCSRSLTSGKTDKIKSDLLAKAQISADQLNQRMEDLRARLQSEGDTRSGIFSVAVVAIAFGGEYLLGLLGRGGTAAAAATTTAGAVTTVVVNDPETVSDVAQVLEADGVATVNTAVNTLTSSDSEIQAVRDALNANPNDVGIGILDTQTGQVFLSPASALADGDHASLAEQALNIADIDQASNLRGFVVGLGQNGLQLGNNSGLNPLNNQMEPGHFLQLQQSLLPKLGQ